MLFIRPTYFIKGFIKIKKFMFKKFYYKIEIQIKIKLINKLNFLINNVEKKFKSNI